MKEGAGHVAIVRCKLGQPSNPDRASRLEKKRKKESAMPKESVTLYYQDAAANSDKFYEASIEEQDGGFVVNFRFGRRGTSGQSGTKTPNPVPLEKAKAVYDKLVGEKMAKGYA